MREDGDGNQQMEIRMLNKTTLAFAAVLILGTASGVMAADSGENHQDKRSDTFGVNPVEPRHDPAVQLYISPDQGVRTEGRGSNESLRQEKREERREELREDREDKR
jgi:hypothetical protein